MSGITLDCTVDLPPGYRSGDILAFHRRDPLAISESAQGEVLQKGLVWAGQPACLTVRFHTLQAEAELAIDGPIPGGGIDGLRNLLHHVLGLRQRVEAFEAQYRGHPLLGLLIARNPGLRVATLATPFEGLTWAISGQQISVRAAIALRRRLIQMAGPVHSSGLRCYPDAERLIGFDAQQFAAAGFSRAKAQTLMAVAHAVAEGYLPLDEWMATVPVAEIRDRLASIRGVGPWTIDYTLLRGFGWLDGSLHGDAGVRRGLQKLLASEEPIGAEAAQRWLSEYAPWRALVGAHLWALNTA